MVITANDLGNGMDVAEMFFLYINTFGPVETAFCSEMMSLEDDVKHNFTLLCVDWLKALAGRNTYDLRNEASVMYARDVCALLEGYIVPGRKNLSAKDSPTEYSFEWENHADAAKFMEYYLRQCKTNDDFIKSALRSHRTLQQTFTRLCCKWFSVLADVDSRKEYVRLAKKLNTLRRGFPFV